VGEGQRCTVNLHEDKRPISRGLVGLIITQLFSGGNEMSTAVKRRRINLRRFIPLYIMTLPGLAYLLINNYMPMFGLSIAFKDINYAKGIWGSDWVGFKNFNYLFATSDAYIITRNTILYNAVFILLGLSFAILIAILLNEIRSRFSQRFYQSAMILPHMISIILVS